MAVHPPGLGEESNLTITHARQVKLSQGVSLLAVLGLAACNLPRQPDTRADFATALAQAATQAGLASPTAAPDATAAANPATTQPAPGEPQGQIVYTCQTTLDSLRNQLCIINADGTGQRQLTFDESKDHFFASVAPEGESILFSSNRDGGYEVYELSLDGGEPVALTTTRNNFAPTASPDGTTIVFTHARGPNLWDGQIWLIDRDGGDLRQLTFEAGGGWDATWSPDGTQVLFATHTGGNIQMAVITIATGDVTIITDLVGLRGRNDWSIHGILSTYIGSPWEREIITFAPDGSNVYYLTEGGNNLAPSFSPDGNWITYTSYRDRVRDPNGCEIYIMRVTGQDIRRLTDNFYCDWQPRWGTSGQD